MKASGPREPLESDRAAVTVHDEVGVRPRKSRDCWMAKAEAESKGANGVAGARTAGGVVVGVVVGGAVLLPPPATAGAAASSEGSGSMAWAQYHFTLGLRISKCRCEPVPSALPLSPTQAICWPRLTVAPSTMPGANAQADGFLPSSVPGESLLMWR